MHLHIHFHYDLRYMCINIYIKILISRQLLPIATYLKREGWERMVENCSVCGKKLDKEMKFCPDCGEKVPLSAQTKKIETKPKQKNKTKRKTLKISWPKISLKKVPKPVLAGVALLCVAIIAIAGVFVLSPFDLTGSAALKEKGGRTFAIDIQNTCDSDAKCYLTVSGITYCYFGNNGEFSVPAGETLTVNIVEDALVIPFKNYEISLFADIGHMEKGTATSVTESAGFVIYPSEIDGEFFIESAGVR